MASTAPAAAGSRPAPDSVDLRRYWPQVLDRVRDRSRRTRALLDNAPIGSVDGTVIRLAASSAVIAKMVSDESNLSVLRAALADFVGGGWQVEVGVEGGAAPRTSQPAAQPDRTPAAPPPPVDEAAGVDEETDVVSVDDRPGGGDAEAAALALLQSGLGARRIEQS